MPDEKPVITTIQGVTAESLRQMNAGAITFGPPVAPSEQRGATTFAPPQGSRPVPSNTGQIPPQGSPTSSPATENK